MKDRHQRVRDDGPERRYFSMIPHLATDMVESPVTFNALGLYVYYKRWCGEHGECHEESIRTTAQHLGLSIGRVYAAQQELVRQGLIQVVYEGSHGHERAEITIEDVWDLNMRTYHRPSQRRSTIERKGLRPLPAGAEGVGVQLSNAASGNSGVGVQNSVQEFDEFPDALSLTGKKKNVREEQDYEDARTRALAEEKLAYCSSCQERMDHVAYGNHLEDCRRRHAMRVAR